MLKEPKKNCTCVHCSARRTELPALIEREKTLANEVKRLKIELDIKDCLAVSEYRAGVQAGWSLGLVENNDGLKSALSNSDNIAELKRLQAARAALAGQP